ncbi:hypothetical protein ACFV4N_22775 [Actinosynnema sp. NPDC059797]
MDSAVEAVTEVAPPDDSGSDTSDRYHWQACMAAADGLAIYRDSLTPEGMLPADLERSVLCEYHEDWVVISGQDAELVSAKHRDPEVGPWKTVNQLVDDGGLAHLFGRWVALEEKVHARLVTNASLAAGEPQRLHRTIAALRDPDGTDPPATTDDTILQFVKALRRHWRDLPAHWQDPETDHAAPPEVEKKQKAEVRTFLSVLDIDHGRYSRDVVDKLAPSEFVTPVLDWLGHRDTGPDKVWSAVRDLFTKASRHRKPIPSGSLPVVLTSIMNRGRTPERIRTEENLAARTVTLADIDAAIRTSIAPLPQESRVGVPITQVTDPLTLEVHRAITLDQSPQQDSLTRYVRRAHDEQLARVVARAIEGDSSMAVLVAGSSTGKTRACWEALHPILAAGGWRLWHPFAPTRAEALLDGLDQVGPRTVVWLNETQEYLGVNVDTAERVAAKLRKLLADQTLAPVLVLGTLWPEHHSALPRDSASQVRAVLEGTVIEVAESFTDCDSKALAEAAEADPRLAWAVKHAESGRITQYLAGAPELLQRYRIATPATKAVISAAMDARRLGHRNALPLALLREAAPAYLSATERDQLDDGWLDRALTDASAPCRGVLGPVTRVRPDLNHRVPAQHAHSADDGQAYRLADYLDQHGRHSRTHLIPPVGFWVAAAANAHPADLRVLAESAWSRGLFRDATQLHVNATTEIDSRVAHILIKYWRELWPDDPRPAQWAAAHVSLDNPYGVNALLQMVPHTEIALLADRVLEHIDLGDPSLISVWLPVLTSAGATDQAATLIEQASQVALYDWRAVERLVECLHAAGAVEQVAVLRDRAVDKLADAVPDNPVMLWSMMRAFHAIGAVDQVCVIAKRAIFEADLDDVPATRSLLHVLHEVHAIDHITVLVDRIVAEADLSDPWQPVGTGQVQLLLTILDQVATVEQITVLADRILAGIDLTDPDDVRWTIELFSPRGLTEWVSRLARHAVINVAVDNLCSLDGLLEALCSVGASEHATALARRAARKINRRDPEILWQILQALHTVEAFEEIENLAGATVDVTLDDTRAVEALLRLLQMIGETDHLIVLARRVAHSASINDTRALRSLLHRLYTVPDGPRLTTVLAGRIDIDAAMLDPESALWLLRDLHEVGATEQAMALADRLAAEVIGSPHSMKRRLEVLHAVGAADQVAALAVRAGPLVAVDDLPAVEELLATLQSIGAKDQVAVVGARAARRVLHTLQKSPRTDSGFDRRYSLLSLMKTLRSLGANEQFSTLADRVVATIALDNWYVVTDLMKQLHEAGAEEQLAVLLARDPASQVPLREPRLVTEVLETLHHIGALEQTAKLVERAAAHVTLHRLDTTSLGLLVTALGLVNAADHAAMLVDRYPASGLFDAFLQFRDHRTRFRFGREPDASAAISWAWDDLTFDDRVVRHLGARQSGAASAVTTT